MEAICANPLFYLGIALGVGAAGGFAAGLILMLAISSKVRLW
jgi:hypothetical protein